MSNSERETASPAAVTYTARVIIAGYVSAETSPVEISTLNGDKRFHAVFALTGLSLFPANFVVMSLASQLPTVYQYPTTKPAVRDVALRFVREKLPPGWEIHAALGSCWTPTGWRPPPAGITCESFPLQLQNSTDPSLPLVRYEGSKVLHLRFAVSVSITP